MAFLISLQMYLLLEQDTSSKTCMVLCVENCEMSSFFLRKKVIFFKKCCHFGCKNVTENVLKTSSCGLESGQND